MPEKQRGWALESVHDSYQSVALADVYANFANCLRHRDEVETYLAEHERAGAAIRATIESGGPPEGLRATLLARLES